MITVGGSFAALLINFPLGACLGAGSVVMKCFLVKLPTTKELIDQFRELATIARRDGLLSLEGEVEKVVKASAEILKACVDLGGSISGEHGIGSEKKNYMS